MNYVYLNSDGSVATVKDILIENTDFPDGLDFTVVELADNDLASEIQKNPYKYEYKDSKFILDQYHLIAGQN